MEEIDNNEQDLLYHIKDQDNLDLCKVITEKLMTETLAPTAQVTPRRMHMKMMDNSSRSNKGYIVEQKTEKKNAHPVILTTQFYEA